MASIRIGRYHRLVGNNKDVFVSARPKVSANYKLAMIDVNKTVTCERSGTVYAYLFYGKTDVRYITYTWERNKDKTTFRTHSLDIAAVSINDFIECDVIENKTQLGDYK